MVYPGDPEIARALGGGPTDDELAPGALAAAMDFGKDQIFLITNKEDWTTDDPVAGSIAMARQYFASSYLRDNWIDKEKKAKEHFERAVSILKGVLRNPNNTSLIAPDTEHVSLTYVPRTRGLNPDAPYYKSPRTDI
jgi:hypothetical protein